MKLTQKYNFKNLRKIVPILGLGVAAATFSPGCSDGEEGLIKNQPPMPPAKHHAVLELKNLVSPSAYIAKIDSALARPDVDSVFILAEHTDEYKNMTIHSIVGFVGVSLVPFIEQSPRVTGRGDFNFKPGLMSKYEAGIRDSIWLTSHGWTINKHLQEQNQKQK